ncbi:metalloendopeptidase-like membrane protein [Methylomicrobium album BG8]|uniref:Metalloendopeptidase-like membrane protein n=2 Tax=Methylococcaceae TaxID=403 RepID=H8GNR8_METAL|nr:metalloendopeptidase-like membrane protein [Methylomicrobium album BG8]
MLTTILTALMFGCTERTDLAPVWSGYQNLNEVLPQKPSALSVAAGPATPAPLQQTLPPVPANRYAAPAQTKPHSAQPQAPAPVARPRSAVRTAKNENKIKPVMMASAQPVPEKKKPESEPAKPARQKPAAKKSTAVSTGTEKDNAQLHFDWPLAGKLLKNYAQTGKKGIKIAGKKDQAVRAAERGKVVYSGQGLIGYGNLLIIKHNDQYLTAYANNNALLAKEGDAVKKGQEIATVGVGASRKAMLHFEIRKQGKSVNPLTLLPKL